MVNAHVPSREPFNAMHLPRLFGGIRRKVARPIVAYNNFQEGFGDYTDQNTSFTNKRGNNWESSEVSM